VVVGKRIERKGLRGIEGQGDFNAKIAQAGSG
jgi:hypothetical protein